MPRVAGPSSDLRELLHRATPDFQRADLLLTRSHVLERLQGGYHMITKIVEVTNNQLNWGKFMLLRFDEAEWKFRSTISGMPLFQTIGWNPRSLWVLDLQTCEGAAFRPGGVASYDLKKHKIWVCPMFEPFLEWLYLQNLDDLDKLPAMVNLPDAEFAFAGYRRQGP